MYADYELFERRADGSLNWRGVVHSGDSIPVALRLLAEETGHVCFAAGPSGEVLAVGPSRQALAAESVEWPTPRNPASI